MLDLGYILVDLARGREPKTYYLRINAVRGSRLKLLVTSSKEIWIRVKVK